MLVIQPLPLAPAPFFIAAKKVDRKASHSQRSIINARDRKRKQRSNSASQASALPLVYIQGKAWFPGHDPN